MSTIRKKIELWFEGFGDLVYRHRLIALLLMLAMAIGLVCLYMLTRSPGSTFRSGSFISYTPGKIAVIVVVVFASILFTTIRAVLPALTVRSLGAEEFGQMVRASAFVHVLWPILIPAGLAVVLVTLRIPGRRDLKYN